MAHTALRSPPSLFKGRLTSQQQTVHSAWRQQLQGAVQRSPAGLLQSRQKPSCCQAHLVQVQIVRGGCAAQTCCCCYAMRRRPPCTSWQAHADNGGSQAGLSTGSITCSLRCLPSLEVSAARCPAGPARQHAWALMLTISARPPALEASAAPWSHAGTVCLQAQRGSERGNRRGSCPPRATQPPAWRPRA